MESKESVLKYEILLGLVFMIRSSGFIFSKILLAVMSNFNVMAFRFCTGFLLLVLVFHRRLKDHINRTNIKCGVIIGFFMFVVMAVDMTALKVCNTSTLAMIENSTVVVVPFLAAAVSRRLPEKYSVISAFIALAGVICLKASQSQSADGLSLAILALFIYSVAIILTGKYSREAEDVLTVGIIQVGTIAICSLGGAVVTNSVRLPQNGKEWALIMTLAILGTFIGYTFQPVCQRHIPVEMSGLLTSLSPATATILSVIILKERFTVLSGIGLLLIFSGIVIPNYIKYKRSINT